ncbi:MAG: VanZ family protein [Bacteroidales bacterium]|nr:VanZ family protein [Bacteroidales bacterium]
MSKRDRIFQILFLAYLGMVLWCCFGHFDNLPKVQRHVLGIQTDKVVHFIMFLPFVFLGYLSFASITKKRSGAALLAFAVFLVGILMAVATEKAQSLTTYRSGDVMDFVADAGGLALAFLCVLALILLRKR